MDYDQFAVDFGKQIADSLNRSVDFSALQKSLPELLSGSMQNIETVLSENLKWNDIAITEEYWKMLNVDLAPLAMSCANAIAEQLNSFNFQNIAVQWADALRKSIQALPIEEFEAQQEIPVEELREALADVKSCLPEEAAGLLDAKVAEVQTMDKKISTSDWIAIIGIIVTIFLSIFEQLSSTEHDQKEEAAWSAIAEYQQESIELKKQDIALKQEILECLKNQNDIAAEIQDTPVNALKTAREGIKSAVDVPDLPDDPQEQETLDEVGRTQD